ncbi:MAG TPA: HNH endonuclease signature motif containing protein [Amycolatopsis sp.]|nr:HNH endonuclease signature motif containing protein [Amycolatopsis sp.]
MVWTLVYPGRESRLATRAQRRTLALRDGGCSAPGCTRTPKWTSVHHVRWWSRGGTTDIDNLTLVCATHHRLIHQAGWQVTIRDNQAWWTLPEWLDPEQTPRRNTTHTTGPPHHHLHHTDVPDTTDHTDHHDTT